MNNRLTSDSANTVSLFPFLAVLLCTMGALLVLLVVLAQRAGERVVAQLEAEQPVVAPAKIQQVPTKDSAAADLLELKLQKVQAYQKFLSDLREQAEKSLQEEQQQLSHLEQHTRRLEHELAKLSLASEQLKATEENQSVDQRQAEQELARLQTLIKDTETQLEDLRQEKSGKKSYAIVPYRGPNGTYRKPIYIECREDAIILHPEGIRLQASDFRIPSWAGNPLAAALRATREHVNAQAAKAGAPEPPDPYPVILVRPDGIPQYSLARAAITSWDASFGYEFVDTDWKLEFPEGPDPLLAREQEHAIMLARDRLARLIRSAPSRFQGTGFGGGGSLARRGAAGFNGKGDGPFSGNSDSGSPLTQSQQDGSSYGNGLAGNSSASGSTEGNREFDHDGEMQLGAMAGQRSAKQTVAGNFENGSPESGEASGSLTDQGVVGQRYAQTAGSFGGGGAPTDNSVASGGGPSAGSGDSAGGAAAPGGGAAPGGAAAPRGAGSAVGSVSRGQTPSIADSRGRNWAVKDGGRGSVPIRRPIQVVVRKNQLAMLPSRHALDGEAATGKVISLDQPMSQISNEFVAALRTRVQGWGLAGSGLYWRPVLKLNVGPEAKQTASEVLQLLKDSGVEVSLPETARASQGGTENATR